MEQLSLEVNKSQTSKIFIGSGLQRQILRYIDQLGAGPVTYITEKPLAAPLQAYLQPDPGDSFILSTGESQKNLDNVIKALDFLHSKQAGKNSLAVSFGGGVVSDITGFAASIYNRGIRTIYIPTTLLAMVDAAIGGKNGVNFRSGKNLVGTIYNPEAIFVDVTLLKSLPREEFLSGLGEIAKIAIVRDRQLFQLLQKPLDENLELVISRAIAAKIDVVKRDPYEASAVRQTLNFGHTLGHALESTSDFHLKHGLAVAIGCHFATYVSWKKNYIPKADYEKIINLLENLGLPLTTGFKVPAVMKFIKSDKKKVNDKGVNFVLVSSIGECLVESVSFKEIERYLIQFQEFIKR